MQPTPPPSVVFFLCTTKENSASAPLSSRSSTVLPSPRSVTPQISPIVLSLPEFDCVIPSHFPHGGYELALLNHTCAKCSSAQIRESPRSYSCLELLLGKMDGLGHGYGAFVERIQEDFCSANAQNTSNTSAHGNGNAYSLYSPQFICGVKKESSLSPSDGAIAGGSTPSDVAMHETGSSTLQVHNVCNNNVNQMPKILPCHGHRRAHSEVAFRLPSFEHGEQAMFETPTVSDEASDDMFSMYFDVEQLNCHGEMSSTGHSSKSPSDTSGQLHHMRSLSMDGVLPGVTKPEHHHSSSMDATLPPKKDHLTVSDSNEAKKAMAASKLAELALLDPKRAKRILANRQSAARSKERKMRYIAELERKVQTLQTEATTLSAQLTMLQRDITGLVSENSELKLRLQSMEQQGQLRDALSDALRDEVQRLKLATGQINGSSSNNNRQMIPPDPQNQQVYQQMQQHQQQHTHSAQAKFAYGSLQGNGFEVSGMIMERMAATGTGCS